ncbi:MAG: hypothetical protein HY928_10985 [Elusimicrobia bacterium]|nr:hypothetical protein [Elusimicrobiota bacterium]
MRAGALVLLALVSAGCANPPRFVRRTPVLRLLYRPYGHPYLENPKFSFEMKRGWKGPEFIEGGVRFRHPRRRADISIAYHVEGANGWVEPKRYRRWMREQGSTEDRHIVEEVRISSYPASHTVYTTHTYDPEYLLGAKSDVGMTEVFMLPDDQGIFLIRYEAPRRWFHRYRSVFTRFLESLALAVYSEPVEQ